MRALSEASELLESDIRNGLFTPFLGAGASSLRPREGDLRSYPWKEVASTLTSISTRLKTGRSREFIRSFAKYRLALSSVTSVDVDTIIPPLASSCLPETTGTNQSLLTDFQAELVRATVHLTHCFGVRLSQESPSMSHVEDYSVEFDLGSESIIGDLAHECIARLFAAASLALDLQGQPHDQRESPFLVQVPGAMRSLEIRSLYRKLLVLIVGLIGRHRPLYRDDFAKHQIGNHLPIPSEVQEGRGAFFGELRLDSIQWISDLLWYTVRYWVPLYPTTAELAFELSLAVRDAPPRRAELAQVAQALENGRNGESLSSIVGNIVAYCEAAQEGRVKSNWEPTVFYCAIAAAIQSQFELYIKRRPSKIDAPAKALSLRDSFKVDRQAEEIGVGKASIPVPIVFTTNLDSALERVLRANDLGFHIVFPVTTGRPEDEAQPPIWRIRTDYPKSKHLHSTTSDWSGICNDNGVPQISFEGPIVVKLHGSPTLALDEVTDQHWLVLSESSYLQALATRVPAWLEQQLSSDGGWIYSRGSRGENGRSLWFLGYSISDWNVRLRLYNEWPEHRRSRRVRRIAVNQGVDVFRTAILTRLGVEQCIGDLNDFPSMVFSILREAQ